MSKRRKKGEGTIWQRSDGYWVAQLVLGYSEDGKRRRSTIGALSYAELIEKRDRLIRQYKAGLPLIPSTSTISDLLDRWFESIELSVRPKTASGYAQTIKRTTHYIGGSRVASFDTGRIAALFSSMIADGYATSTVLKTRQVFSCGF